MLCFVLFLKVAVAFVWVLFVTSFLDSSCYRACMASPLSAPENQLLCLFCSSFGPGDASVAVGVTEGGLRTKRRKLRNREVTHKNEKLSGKKMTM